MTAFNHAAFYAALRAKWGPLKQIQVDDLEYAIRIALAAQEPVWVSALRAKIGEKEIPGPKQNAWIQGLWAKLGAPWLKSEDDAWCGAAVAYAMNEAGIAYPKNFPAAASWATWGDSCVAQVGAVAVKARKGGNHVFLIVGKTADGKYYKALSGNQSNGVSITDIPVADVYATRWPNGVARLNGPLPVMTAGTIASSEA